MNWIRLLYPKPHFDLRGWPRIVQAVHGRGLALAYYVSQTLALLGLAALYLVVLLPLKGAMACRKNDPLGFRLLPDTESYLKKSEPVSEIDFTRMY